jgi:hypothetical protein
VQGVGRQNLIFQGQQYVAIVVQGTGKASEKSNVNVLKDALNECELDQTVHGYGMLKWDGATGTELEPILGDISSRQPGPKKAVQPEDDKPKKRKTPACKDSEGDEPKRQRATARSQKRGGGRPFMQVSFMIKCTVILLCRSAFSFNSGAYHYFCCCCSSFDYLAATAA